MQLTAKKLETNNYDENGHLTEIYYKEQLEKAKYSKSTIKGQLEIYRNFKRVYPNIQSWFEDSLKVRVSNVREQNICYNARIYIYMMALNGLKLDYDYLFSLSGVDGYVSLLKRYEINIGLNDLVKTGVELNYSKGSTEILCKWSLYRILLHTGKAHYSQIKIEDIREFKDTAIKYCNDIEKIKAYDGYKENIDINNLLDKFSGSSFRLQLMLYCMKIINVEPKKEHSRRLKLDRNMSYLKSQKIAEVMVRYLNQIATLREKGTCNHYFRGLHNFAIWLEKYKPEITNLEMLNRKDIEEYLTFLKTSGTRKTNKEYCNNTYRGLVSNIKCFFDDVLAWEYENVPRIKLLFDYDLPDKPKSMPKYILNSDLESLMEGVKKIECPYQRNALILARWTGARREEIRRLDINALDYYTDGTPKLYVPIGKTNSSRWVPINKEAEDSYKELLSIRKIAGNLRGLVDRKTKKETDYLFMRKNQMLSESYLFTDALEQACNSSGLLTTSGKPKYTAHQFRHTMGTTLANNGANITTIMKILGHESPDMSMTYASIFDSTVKDEYEKAMTNNQKIAGGEFAISIKQHELKEDEVNWIKSNFHKTYLMTGHCFHHTRETMCDFADACFFCSKYVATEENIAVLLDKYKVELQLIQDAIERGWDKEVTRHTKVSERVKEILIDLGVDVNA